MIRLAVWLLWTQSKGSVRYFSYIPRIEILQNVQLKLHTQTQFKYYLNSACVGF